MPCFKCSKCGCVENTAACGYWSQSDPLKKLCSECDPKIGKWHGIFQKLPATGQLVGNDGYLYSQAEIDSGSLAWRIEHQGFKIVGPA